MHKKRSKSFLYIKMVVSLAVGNRLRFILTLLGLSLGIFIYTFGNLLLEGYYYGNLREAEVIPENSMYITMSGYAYEQQTEVRSNLYIRESQNLPMMVRSGFTNTLLASRPMSGGGTLRVFSNVQAVTKMTDQCLYYSSERGNRLLPFELECGRYITAREILDNEPVIVIDSYTAQLLFGERDPLGQTIRLGGNDGITQEFVPGSGQQQTGGIKPVLFTVVGVVKNNYYVEKMSRETEKLMTDTTYVASTAITVNVYCPYNYYQLLGEEENYLREISMVWEEKPEEYTLKKQQLEADIKNLDINYGVNNVVYDKAFFLEALETQLQPVRFGIQTASLILLLIAGISSMSILFFAMKERMAEIGIKKAFGASIIDILVQFLYENMLIAFIGSLIAVGLAFMVAWMAEGYIAAVFFSDFKVICTVRSVILPLLIGCIQGCLFSLLPCLLAACSSVTSALRMDA